VSRVAVASIALVTGALALAIAGAVVLHSVKGQVLDAETGEPLAGVTVAVGEKELLTDAQGSFTVVGLERLRPVRVQAPGYRPLQGASVPGGLASWQPAFTLALDPVVLTGVVRDVGTQAPIPGATVRVGEHEVLAGADGSYAVKRVLPGVEVSARAPYHQAARPVTYSGQETVDLWLEYLPTTIMVQDVSGGQPLAGAQVTAGGATVQSDEKGRVIFARLQPETEVRASLAGYEEARGQAGPGDTLVLSLRRSAVRGTVRDQNGKPVAGALVLARVAGQEPRLAYTDAEGRYELQGLPANAKLLVRKAGFAKVERDLAKEPNCDFGLQPFVAKGIYLAFHFLRPAYAEQLQNNLAMVDRTELNTVVIEIKTETGYLGFQPQNPVAQAIGAGYDDVIDVRALLANLKQRGIYSIARIPIFEDDLLATKRPEWAVHTAGGGVWRAAGGRGWVDPFRKEVWDYDVSIAKEAIGLGFDEVQFDYVRFPSDGYISNCRYIQESTSESRVKAITGFIAYARQELDKVGAFFSIDTFGLTTFDHSEQGVGQMLDQMAQYVDYASPMVYPSTYLVGMLNLSDPWRQPYEVVKRSLDAAHQKTSTLIRPWLQHYDDYHGVGIKYGLPEYMAQKQAAADGGSWGWLWWNILGEYDERTFAPAQ